MFKEIAKFWTFLKALNSKMKNKLIKFTLLILVISISTNAQTANSANEPAKEKIIFHNLNNDAVPLFAFTYISPWRNTYGSDQPEFVLYQDGTLIYTKCREKDNTYSCYYQMAKLSPEEISQTMEKLNPQEFYSFENHYSPDTSKFAVSDLTFRQFVMRKPDGTYKNVSTYGALSGDKSGYVAENIPKALNDLVKFVASYENENTIDFDFEYVELIIEPYGDEEDLKKTIKWSKELPDLNDPKTIKHKEYGAYSLFISGSSKKFSDVIYKLRKYQLKDIEAALSINKQNWKEEIRKPFPSEKVWLGDFRNE